MALSDYFTSVSYDPLTGKLRLYKTSGEVTVLNVTVKGDMDEQNPLALNYIKNKPVIGSVETIAERDALPNAAQSIVLVIETNKAYINNGTSWIETADMGEVAATESFLVVPAWAAGTYDVDHVVTHGGTWYRALVSTSEEPPHADWETVTVDDLFGELVDCTAPTCWDYTAVLTGQNVPLDNPGASSQYDGICVQDNNIFVGGYNDNNIYRYNHAGTLQETISLGSIVFNSDLTVHNGTIYHGDNSYRVYKREQPYNTTTSTQLVAYVSGTNHDFFAFAADYIYTFGVSHKRIHKIHPDTGAITHTDVSAYITGNAGYIWWDGTHICVRHDIDKISRFTTDVVYVDTLTLDDRYKPDLVGEGSFHNDYLYHHHGSSSPSLTKYAIPTC